MYKKIISGSLVAVTVMLTGCGNDATTCRIDVQKAIDEGRYDDAIADMNGSCKTAFTKSDLDMNFASAYMGKSGYSVSDIADMLIDSNDNSSNDAFSSFITSVNKKKVENSNTLPLLNKASNYFKDAITDGNATNATNICNDPEEIKNNARASNACLYIGFNDVIKTATTITYLTGDVNKLVDSINNDSNTTPYDMLANMDALAWSIGSDYTKNDATITALPIKIKNKSFVTLKVSYKDHGTFYRLAKSMTQDTNNSTVITDGYCDVNGDRTVCTGIENEDGSIKSSSLNKSCYACPISFDTNSTDTDVSQLLVDALNGGSDTISTVSDDQDIQDSINDFKKNITGSKDGNVTVQDIMDYLQK